MNEIKIVLMMMIYGVVGFYMDGRFRSRERLESFYSLFYALLAIEAICNPVTNVLTIFFTNVVWGITINTGLMAVDRRLGNFKNPLWFGVYGLLNRIIKVPISVFIDESSVISAYILLFIGVLSIFIDLSLCLRSAKK